MVVILCDMILNFKLNYFFYSYNIIIRVASVFTSILPPFKGKERGRGVRIHYSITFMGFVGAPILRFSNVKYIRSIQH